MPLPHPRFHPSWPGLLGAALLLVGCPSDPLEVHGSGSSTSGTSTGSDPSATSKGTGPVGSTSSGGLDGTDHGGDPMDCCAAHPEAGCGDNEVAACVCKQEASCCAFAWDVTCVELADQCGGCDPATGDGTTSGSTGGGPMDVCCEPSNQPGCAEDLELEACVCALDDFCCANEWDGQCVDAAQRACGLQCNVVPGGDCCTANGTPGCDEPPVQECVCDLDPYCCNNEWDGLCVSEAQYACGDECGLPPPNMGDCCMPQPAPGCEDPAVTDCTCMINGGCCLFPWNDECIQIAVTACAIMCEGVDPLSPCCLPSMSPGCGDMMVEDCVCAFDPFCCDNEWDGQCVDEAQMDCMVDCG